MNTTVIPMGIDETTGEPLPTLPVKPYTVLLLPPDYVVSVYELNTLVYKVTAINPAFAVEAACAAAMFDIDGIKDSDDMFVIGVIDGHHDVHTTIDWTEGRADVHHT